MICMIERFECKFQEMLQREFCANIILIISSNKRTVNTKLDV